ncbi:MAG TPA: hypothetical protein ENJ32_09115 [Crenotrichaceae bacterium]|nr:hypothetical protein [Crenotrichaceae bacterium]
MQLTQFKNILIGTCIVCGLSVSTITSAKWITKDGKPAWVDDAKPSSSRKTAAPSDSASTTPADASSDSSAINKAAVDRTRKQILMLDDLYKTAVVAITEHYVNDPSTLSAASAAKVLFAAMKKNGWHEARLLGFTDVLFNASENAPSDEFENKSKQALLDGAANYEEVVSTGGKDYLRMATAVPVVMEKCVMCHADFKGKKGAIGAISYKVELIQ